MVLQKILQDMQTEVDNLFVQILHTQYFNEEKKICSIFVCNLYLNHVKSDWVLCSDLLSPLSVALMKYNLLKSEVFLSKSKD